ncbi:DUF6247 family protein [Nonomuraea sp. NPDC050556]|uniref:DUF6247 family protein n=1 Tax=Nonomuraea sp. NPDC050556 TaxID=3364369 RepID=UPI0037B7094A
MSAEPVEEPPAYDPAVILDALPPAKREHFLFLYRQAWEAARQPENFHRLHELLHLWSLKARMYARDPDFDRTPEEIEAELAAGDGGAYLEDVLPEFQQRLLRHQGRQG